MYFSPIFLCLIGLIMQQTRLFGYKFKRVNADEPISFVPQINDDGAAIVSSFGSYGTALDLDGTVRTEAELITKYREMSLQPEIDAAIEDIVDEAIVQDDSEPIVKLILDETPLPDNIKNIIQQEFNFILNLLKFNIQAYDLFKRYYIDGRLYFHALVHEKAPELGVIELRYIDPRKMRRVKEVSKIRDKTNPDLIITQTKSEYFIYNEAGFNKVKNNFIQSNPSVQGIKISKDSIVHVVSGLQDVTGTMVLSYLNKAIRVMNQLRAIEDAAVIYRLTRSTERRVFYIDVGNLPKHKAEQHLRDIMVKHKNKLVYDANSGRISDSRKFINMQEDFWIPRRADGKATEITTLPAGASLGEMSDTEYFQKKLYQALNVPITRLDPERTYSIGRGSEITRDEIKFSKFINRLRLRFSELFTNILEKQLILKMILTPEDWDLIRPTLRYRFARDVFAAELKDAEIMSTRLNLLAQIDPYAGVYFSRTEIRSKILKQSDEDIERNDQQIAAEMQIPQFNQLLMPPGMGGQEQEPDK